MPRVASRLSWVVVEVLQSTMEIVRGQRASEILVCWGHANVFDRVTERGFGSGHFRAAVCFSSFTEHHWGAVFYNKDRPWSTRH